jgi:hypothetical protein
VSEGGGAGWCSPQLQLILASQYFDFFRGQYRYFGDPELTIKRNSFFCDERTARENFCLLVSANRYTELVSLYTVEGSGCGQLVQCDRSSPIYPGGDPYVIVGYDCTYVLQPGRTYFISYVRYGVNPLLRFKKFRVIDPEHVEVLDDWRCEGPQCLAPDQYGLLRAAEAVKRMCEGGGKA